MDPRKLKVGDKVVIGSEVRLSPTVTIGDDSKPELTGVVVGVAPRKGRDGLDTQIRIKLDLNGRTAAEFRLRPIDYFPPGGPAVIA